MNRNLSRCILACILGVGISGEIVLVLARCFAAEKAPPKPTATVAQVLPPEAGPDAKIDAVQQPPAGVFNLADLSKFGVESPTKKILAARTVPDDSIPKQDFVNPKVQPGKVHWHDSFATACSAAKKSGKPVLLFQMMGNLDQRFC